MIEYIKNILPKVKEFSKEIDTLSKIYNQPWVIITEKESFTKLIFQDSNRLIVSIDGIVSNGKWELLSTANSILLEFNNQRRLYNKAFLDDAIIVLKLDGLSENFFVLANQAKIPNLNIEEYLIDKYIKNINNIQQKTGESRLKYESEIPLDEGRTLQVVKFNGYTGLTKVRINGNSAKDGFYLRYDNEKLFELKDDTLVMDFNRHKVNQSDGNILQYFQPEIGKPKKGTPVFLNGKLAPDGKYEIGFFSTITVWNGKIK